MRNFETTTAAAAELDPLSEQPLVSAHDDASDSSSASSCVDTRGCYEMEDKPPGAHFDPSGKECESVVVFEKCIPNP